jgi:hypothetical protein
MSTLNSSTKMVWTGRFLSALFILFMLGASIAPKLFFPDSSVVQKSMEHIGWPQKFLLLIAVIELLGTILYAIPRTSVLGAVLMTGLLGAAIAAKLRVDSPMLSHTLFGIYLGLVMWAGLWLRSPALRSLFPFRQT